MSTYATIYANLCQYMQTYANLRQYTVIDIIESQYALVNGPESCVKGLERFPGWRRCQHIIPNTKYQIHHPKCTIPNLKFTITNTKNTIPNSKYTIPNTLSQIPKTQFWIPNAPFKILKTKYLGEGGVLKCSPSLASLMSLCQKTYNDTGWPLGWSACISKWW